MIFSFKRLRHRLAEFMMGQRLISQTYEINQIIQRREEQQVALARKSLCSLDPHDNGFEGKTDIEMKRIEIDCRKLLGFKTLSAVIDDLKAKQRNLMATSATRDNIDFARGVLSGINLVSERLRIFAERASTKSDEDFNKYEPI